ncbi:hypothetical protein BJV78DRAFT_196833 [Lactifluus subvellereus]|nr:hypothetical protein BJV78DRAFT_196833 [Lactifluus subvellereus]
MLAIHSGSALAMALRKLHSSFAKRTAEMEDLREYISSLEAERDEAWAQAQQVAKDLDNLNDTLQSQDSSPAATRPSSCRSSRVMASRKSSIRLSKAGLRVSRSQRASMASQVGSSRLSYASSAGTQPTSPGPIPPVPRIPDRLSTLNCITTPGLSSRGSARTSELSFSSEAHALARAQAELYGYLGIDDPELRPSPLRRSSIAASPSALSPVTRDDALRRMSDTATDRWATKGGSPLDRFQAYMENEPGALLATLNFLDT